MKPVEQAVGKPRAGKEILLRSAATAKRIDRMVKTLSVRSPEDGVTPFVSARTQTILRLPSVAKVRSPGKTLKGD